MMKRNLAMVMLGLLLLSVSGCTSSASLESAPAVDIYVNGGGRYGGADETRELHNQTRTAPFWDMSSWAAYSDEKSIRDVTNAEIGPLQGKKALAGALRNALNSSLKELQEEGSYLPGLFINNDGSKATLYIINKGGNGKVIFFKKLPLKNAYVVSSQESIGTGFSSDEMDAFDQLKAKSTEKALRQLLALPDDWTMVSDLKARTDILNGVSGPLAGESHTEQRKALLMVWQPIIMQQEQPGSSLSSVMWHNKDGTEFMISTATLPNSVTATWLKATTGTKLSYEVVKQQTLALD